MSLATAWPDRAWPQPAPTFDTITAELRGRLLEELARDASPDAVRANVARVVVAAMGQVGRLYYHKELVDFDSAMFFDGARKRLVRIGSDEFRAWLSSWTRINRSEILFRAIMAGVETAALDDATATGILPESYWASRPGCLYISNGDGRMAKITPGEVELVDNGTDGVLFPAGKTLAEWKLVAPVDPFAACRLFSQARCADPHGAMLFRLFACGLPTTPRSKPVLCLPGVIGSGKTTLVRGLCNLWGIPLVAQPVDKTTETQFWPGVNEGGIYLLDNADTRTPWLADAVANAATGGSSKRRRLYTDSDTLVLRARAWLAITTANPTFGNDAGLADRLVIVRMTRTDGAASDQELQDEILAHRDAGLSHVCRTLAAALADRAPVPAGLNARHPDWGAFSIRIGRALGAEQEAVVAVRAAEADKSRFCLENDPIGAALMTMLQNTTHWAGTAAALLERLQEIDQDLGAVRDDGKPIWGAKRVGKRLAAIWPHVVVAFPGSTGEKDRNGVQEYRFKGGLK